MFPTFFILRSLRMVPPSLEFNSQTNILADGFNVDLLTVGSGTGKAQPETFPDKERATLVTRELRTELTAEQTESFRGTYALIMGKTH